MASCSAEAPNKAAVLHGINDLRVEDFPIPKQVAPGHVSARFGLLKRHVAHQTSYPLMLRAACELHWERSFTPVAGWCCDMK